MLIFATILITVVSTTSVVPQYNITYDQNLKCGTCVQAGYNYCWRGKEGERSTSRSPDKFIPFNMKWGAICCKNANCKQARRRGYTCTSFYTDKLYALSQCPESRAKCGSRKEIEFNDAGEQINIRVFNLEQGDKCTYKLNAKCGSPFFKVDNFTDNKGNELQVSFIEFDWAKAKKAPKCKPLDFFFDFLGCQTFDDMPPKDIAFDFTGNMGQYDDQYLPKRKTKQGQWKKAIKLKGNIFDKFALDEIEDDDEGEGIGAPAAGFYDIFKGGFKSFGTVGQGKSKKGARKKKEPKCRNRKLLVTVTSMPPNPNRNNSTNSTGSNNSTNSSG